MKIISNSALRAFAALQPRADEALQGWRRVIEKNRFASWAELKTAFNTVDKVSELAVFDVGGNKYRLMAYIRFEKQIVYIKALLAHRQCGHLATKEPGNHERTHNYPKPSSRLGRIPQRDRHRPGPQ